MSGETALRERAELLDELRQIVQSMKNLAFAELQRVSRQRQAHDDAAATVTEALQALPNHPDDRPGAITSGHLPAPGYRRILLVMGAERGFCGAFNAQLAKSLQEASDTTGELTWVASHRLLDLLGTSVPSARGIAGCASSDEMDHVVDAWSDLLRPELDANTPVTLLYASASGLTRLALWPVPPAPKPSRQAGVQALIPPIVPLPVAQVRSAIERQHVRLQLLKAVCSSLEQENHWRLAQMQRAQDHLDELGQQLRRRYAHLRQANITNELETLASADSPSTGH